MFSDKCEIIHIPDKPPISPAHQPTVNVLASLIDPKFANTVIRKLNQVAPFENLRHVKRVRKCLNDGKIQLSVLLCLASDSDSDLSDVPKDVVELIRSYQLSTFVTQVCKYAATTKEEWVEQCKLWPTSYHPPTYNIEGVAGFSDEGSQTVFDFMEQAINLATAGKEVIDFKSQKLVIFSGAYELKLSAWVNESLKSKYRTWSFLKEFDKQLYGDWYIYQAVNAAIIVDPSNNQVIATARDDICSWHTSPKKNGVDKDTFSLHHCNADSSGALLNKLRSNSTDDDQIHLYTDVQCLNPWQWSQQSLSTVNSCYWHPLRHAALVAIENSAARDRTLFPGTDFINENFIQEDPLATCSPAKRMRTASSGADNEKIPNGVVQSDSVRPYLCTGFDIYLAWEPCVMCAMALVHQRIRRIFYAFPNPHTGALGSVHRLQGEKSLNHHYAVFRVKLPKDVAGFATQENDKDDL